MNDAVGFIIFVAILLVYMIARIIVQFKHKK